MPDRPDDVQIIAEIGGRQVPVNFVEFPQAIIPYRDCQDRVTSIDMGSQCRIGDLFELAEELEKEENERGLGGAV